MTKLLVFKGNVYTTKCFPAREANYFQLQNIEWLYLRVANWRSSEYLALPGPSSCLFGSCIFNLYWSLWNKNIKESILLCLWAPALFMTRSTLSLCRRAASMQCHHEIIMGGGSLTGSLLPLKDSAPLQPAGQECFHATVFLCSLINDQYVRCRC